MSQSPIPISTVRSFMPYIDFMVENGAPVDRWLERFRLPTHAYEDPDTYIPTRNYWDFVSFSSRKEGVEDLGLRLGNDRAYEAVGARVICATYSEPTLLSGLKRFAELVRGEYSGMRVGLSAADDDTVRLVLGKSFEPNAAGFCQTEWMGVMVLIKLVQLFEDKTWQPQEIALRSSGELLPLACGLYPDVRFRMGLSQSSISFPRELLSSPPCEAMAPAIAGLESTSGGRTSLDAPEDFPDSLQRILITYLRDGYPSVDLAAEICQTSTRTLQRRLGDCGLSFSCLVDRARFDLAARLLTETDASSLEIAFETGYEDPSNFARAFRRLSGCSPRAYRCRHTDAKA